MPADRLTLAVVQIQGNWTKSYLEYTHSNPNIIRQTHNWDENKVNYPLDWDDFLNSLVLCYLWFEASVSLHVSLFMLLRYGLLLQLNAWLSVQSLPNENYIIWLHPFLFLWYESDISQKGAVDVRWRGRFLWGVWWSTDSTCSSICPEYQNTL